MDTEDLKKIVVKHDCGDQIMFDDEQALGVLLMDDVVFLNTHWYKEEWPEEARKQFSVNLNCSDLFAWGCSDSERVTMDNLEEVYDAWFKGPGYTDLWVMQKRNEMPQGPVAKYLKDQGIDLDAFQKEHNLRPNFYDNVSKIIYDTRQEFPDICAHEFGLKLEARRTKWAKENGFEIK